MQLFPYTGKREALQQEYSQPPILPSPHFRWVVKAMRGAYIAPLRIIITTLFINRGLVNKIKKHLLGLNMSNIFPLGIEYPSPYGVRAIIIPTGSIIDSIRPLRCSLSGFMICELKDIIFGEGHFGGKDPSAAEHCSVHAS